MVNLDGVRAKVSPQAIKRERYASVNQAMTGMNPFVPKKDNIPRQSVHIENDGNAIPYETKCARGQFYLNGKRYTTPGTGPRWDFKARSLCMPSWKKAYPKEAGIQQWILSIG